MTTKNSPLRVLKAQADAMADMLKTVERGERHPADKDNRMLVLRNTSPAIKFAVIMDDKVLTIETPWQLIKETSEVALSEYILKHMRERRSDA